MSKKDRDVEQLKKLMQDPKANKIVTEAIQHALDTERAPQIFGEGNVPVQYQMHLDRWGRDIQRRADEYTGNG